MSSVGLVENYIVRKMESKLKSIKRIEKQDGTVDMKLIFENKVYNLHNVKVVDDNIEQNIDNTNEFSMTFVYDSIEKIEEKKSGEPTPFFDRNGVRIHNGDIFVYTKYESFENDTPPSDLIDNYQKYEDRVVLHPVFWDEDEKSWCSDVYGDCDNMSGYDFKYVVVLTNDKEHPELYNH